MPSSLNHVDVIVADNVKALYRRGKAHVGAWNPKEARADLERVAELDPSMAKSVQRELVNLDALEKQKISDDRALFEGKIFGWVGETSASFIVTVFHPRCYQSHDVLYCLYDDCFESLSGQWLT